MNDQNGLELSSNEKLEYKFHDLSPRAATIRSLIISEFEIFDNLNYANFQKCEINELSDKKKRESIFKNNPEQPCLFNTLQRIKNDDALNVEERRLARKKARGVIPLSAFANYLTNSSLYSYRFVL